MRFDRFDSERIRKNAADLLGRDTSGISVAGLAHMMHRLARDSEPELAVACEHCEGVWSSDVAECPYCGLQRSRPGGLDEVAGEDDNDEVQGKKARKMELINGGGGAAAVAAVGNGAAAKEPRESKPAAKAATVSQLPRGDLERTEALLDKALREIKKCKADLAKHMWVVGRELAGIREFALWKSRVNEKGKSKYASFKDFCAEEVGFSSQWALKLIAINTYLTEADVSKYGVKACAIMMQAPHDAMDDLRKDIDAEEIKNNKELAKRVATLRKEFGVDKVKRVGDNERGTKGGRPESLTAKAEIPLKTTTIDLWAPPAAKGQESQRATVNDLAKGKCFAAFDAGKVSVYVQVWIDAKTGLLKVGIKAQEPESAAQPKEAGKG